MSRYRNDSYLRYVRSLPCSMTGAPADDAHHLTGLKLGLSGMGMKPDDVFCIPLTRHAHNELHRNPAMWPLQIQWLENTWSNALWQYGPSSDIGQRITEARKYLRGQVGEAMQEDAA